jgi:hypothetical protein
VDFLSVNLARVAVRSAHYPNCSLRLPLFLS